MKTAGGRSSAVLPAYLGALVFAFPCAAVLSLLALAFDDSGNWSSLGKFSLVIVIVVHATAAVPFLIYLIARRCWGERAGVSPLFLYGWPMMLPLAMGVFAYVKGAPPRAFPVVLCLMYVCGVLGSLLWRRLAYPAAGK